MCDAPQPPSIYHEKQRLQLCLLHALNNLYQREQVFTRHELDCIARKLPVELHNGGLHSYLVNSHYNILTGNYDANVLMKVLHTRGAEISFCNASVGANAIDLDDPKLIGFILNFQVRRFGLYTGRHWIAIRKIQNIWYNLDSEIPGPLSIGGNEQLRVFMSQLQHGTEVIRILRITE
ncbi:hypothetical protein KP509_06G077100 [Ceratopteris richardii]|nr:hypothetical protein KP509_06G077100 [Ceratopteris richardii]